MGTRRIGPTWIAATETISIEWGYEGCAKVEKAGKPTRVQNVWPDGAIAGMMCGQRG